jgi:enoyl-CoA hydratase
MLSGQNLDARSALEFGVVDEVVPAEQVHTRALEVAAEYGRIPPRTFAETKRQLRCDVLERVAAAVEGAAEPMLSGWFTEETAEATQAILDALRK